jgi:hypothetical protein
MQRWKKAQESIHLEVAPQVEDIQNFQMAATQFNSRTQDRGM